MSKATKRKYVTNEVLQTYTIPEEPQQIVKVIAGRGNNLHLVETAAGEQYLVSMPTKYRCNVWIKRGDFVVVEPIEEGNKVKAEICQILLKDQIRFIKSEGKWPSAFNDEKHCKNDAAVDGDNLMTNPNYLDISDSASSDESTSEDGEEETEDGSTVE